MPTFDTPQPIAVTIELGNGDLRIAASDRPDTVVDVQPTDPAKPADVKAAHATRVAYANGRLRISAPRGWRRFGAGGGDESIDVRIELPTGSQLHGQAGQGAVSATGTLGECRVKTAGSDITMDEVAGPVELMTSTGAVSVNRIGGSATVKSASGDTWIGEIAGDLAVMAANGAIAVGHATGAVTAKTARGDIRLDDVEHGAIVAQTARGTVDVAVHAGVPAWLDLKTGSGQVRNLLDAAAEPEPEQDSVRVGVRSGSGDITVRRAGVS